jgi:hypothetical protein
VVCDKRIWQDFRADLYCRGNLGGSEAIEPITHVPPKSAEYSTAERQQSDIPQEDTPAINLLTRTGRSLKRRDMTHMSGLSLCLCQVVWASVAILLYQEMHVQSDARGLDVRQYG